MSTKLTEMANSYFATINSIANKIQLDINETKLSYEHIWEELNITDQMDIINETIIKPEIALRYFESSPDDDELNDIVDEDNDDDVDNENKNHTKNIYMYDGKNLSSYSCMKTGRKLLQDDVIGVYRDEHSAPFNVKTKSQLNLNLLITNKNMENNNNNISTNNKIRPNSILEFTLKDPKIIKTHKHKQIINDTLSGTTTKTITSTTTNTNDKIKSIDKCSDGGGNFLNIMKKNQNFDDIDSPLDIGWKNNEEKEHLVSSSSFGIKSSSAEEDDDDKNYDEINCLLENTDIRKGYDFLANW